MIKGIESESVQTPGDSINRNDSELYLADTENNCWVPPENINAQDYEPSKETLANPEHPIKFYTHTKTGEEAFTVLDSQLIPCFDARTLKGHPKEQWLRGLIQDRKSVLSQAMLDRSTVSLIYELSRRFNQGNVSTIEGPAAVSKTYTAWIFAALTGYPYLDVTFDRTTQEQDIQGGRTFLGKEPYKVGLDLLNDELLTTIADKNSESGDPILKNYIDKLKQRIESGGAPLSESDYQHLSDLSGLTLLREAGLGFEDSQISEAIQAGCLVMMDEKNLSKHENALTDIFNKYKTNYGIAGREGKVTKHPRTRVVAAQNPPSKEFTGRDLSPLQILSRENGIKLEENDLVYYKELLTFFIKGQQPRFKEEGADFHANDGVKTEYRRFLEQYPFVDKMIVSLAKLHMAILIAIKERKIGRRSDEGGNYAIDQRTMRNVLEAISKDIKNGHRVVMDRRSGTISNVPINGLEDLAAAFRDALVDQYIDPIQVRDRKLVQDLIDGMAVWNELVQQKPIPSHLRRVIGAKTDSKGRISLGHQMLTAQSEEINEIIEKPSVDSILISMSDIRGLSYDLATFLTQLSDEGDISFHETFEDGVETNQLKIAFHTKSGEKLVMTLLGKDKGKAISPMALFNEKISRGNIT